MTISLNKEIIEKAGLTLNEAITLLVIINKIDLTTGITGLLDKGLIGDILNENKPTGYYFPTRVATGLLENIILDSDKISGNKDILERISVLTPILQSLYPEGKKEGTNQYWRGNKTDIKKKLQSFIKKYGDEFTDEQLITATTEYVAGFNGQYRYMRILQYFIWKEEIKEGTKIASSDLASFIENAGTQTTIEDWTSVAR